MTNNISGELSGIFALLMAEIPGIHNIIFGTSDGFVLYNHQNGSETDYYETGRLLAELDAASRILANRKMGQKLNRVSISSDAGVMHYFTVSDTTGLAVVFEPGSRSGIILLRISRIIDMLLGIVHTAGRTDGDGNE